MPQLPVWQRGVAWENAIKAASNDRYGVIFVVTKTYVEAQRLYLIHQRQVRKMIFRFFGNGLTLLNEALI